MPARAAEPRRRRNSPPPPRRASRRRLLLWGGAALGGAGLWWLGSESRGFALGPPQIVPPLLRIRLGDEDRLLVLVRRAEQEIAGPLALSTPAPGERVELRGFAAADLRPLFVSPLVSQDRGRNADMAILGEQAGTVWLHIGGIGAASAVDGRLLADSPGLQQVSPILQGRLPTARRAFRMDEAGLLVAGTDGTHLRIDPRRFTAGMAVVSLPAVAAPGLPPARRPAPVWSSRDQPFRAAELRLGEHWLGLVRAEHEGARIAAMGPALLRLEFGLHRAEPMRLWHGERGGPDAAGLPDGARAAAKALGAAAAGPMPAGPVPAGQKQSLPLPLLALPQGASARAGTGPERPPSALAPVAIAGAQAGLFDAGFLALPASGPPEALRLEDPPGALLLYRTGAASTGAPLHLARLDPEGRALWDVTLPIAEVTAVVPGTPTLHLAGPLRGGAGGRPSSSSALVAVEPSRGAVTAFDLGAERPLAP